MNFKTHLCTLPVASVLRVQQSALSKAYAPSEEVTLECRHGRSYRKLLHFHVFCLNCHTK
jgi:hypothetical protein